MPWIVQIILVGLTLLKLFVPLLKLIIVIVGDRLAAVYSGNQIHDDELNQTRSKVSVKSHMCIVKFSTLKQFCQIVDLV